jgi:pyruvate dehydrogenase E2 component (dihydrolipoamide acetyltransferase)
MTGDQGALEFRLPDVGEGLAEAEIVRWLVPEGEPVQRMAPMVEIETAKSTVEIPSPVTGLLLRHGAPEGSVIDVGSLLAVLSPADGSARANTEPSSPAAAPAVVEPSTSQPAHEVSEPAREVTGRRRVPAAPTVRRLATRLGIDIADVTATGPAGRVLAEDVRTASDARAGASVAVPTEPHPAGIAAAADRTEKLSPMRMTIMNRLSEAWSKVPLITDMRDVDATALTQARASLSDELGGERVTFTTLFAAVVTTALQRHPVLNASLDAGAGTVTYHASIDLGIAVALPDGLTVGVVRGCERLSLRELSGAISGVAEKARTGRLTAAESRGATFTLSSFGQFGGWYGTPLVLPPQVGIAGFGPIKDAVVAVDGRPEVRPTLPLSVSADHRLVDGAALSAFSSTIERLVAQPVRMLGT